MKSKISLLTILIVGLIAVCGMASAVPVAIEEVKVNGDVVEKTSENYVYDFDKNQDLEVKVRVTACEDVDDVQIEATIRGYDHKDLMQDITDVFDMKEGVTYTKTLEIPLRLRMEQDTYKLRILITNRDGDTTEETYELKIDTKRHLLMIKDVILSPEYEVDAGRALLAAVRVKNYGERDEEGIKVKVSIPELGVSASDYVDELDKEETSDDDDEDDETTSEELYLRIPSDAETGEYTLVVELTYDDGDETEVEEMTIKVRGEEAAVSAEKEKTIITLAADTQTATKGGAEAVYPITITNAGSESKTYVVSADGASSLNFRISPSNVLVIGAGESKAVNVYVAASQSAAAGEQMFSVTVKSGENTLKDIPMKLNVAEGQVSGWSQIKRGLEIGLVVLVILIVILGLIIGFNKLKGSEEEESKEGETYY
jgi:uncharacterized membrane protein